MSNHIASSAFLKIFSRDSNLKLKEIRESSSCWGAVWRVARRRNPFWRPSQSCSNRNNMPKKERRSSVVSTLASIGRALTPKSNSKKGRGSRQRRHSRDDSPSSAESSSKRDPPPTPKSKSQKDKGTHRRQSSSEGSNCSDSKISCSDLSGSEGDLASTCSAEESKMERNSRRSKSHRRHRSREKRRHNDKDRKRTPMRDHHSPDSYGVHTPQRHPMNSFLVVDDDSAQMVNLLMGILPFYGRGDSHSDSVVIDTIQKLSPRALEMQDIDGNNLLILACQASAYDLLPLLLSKGCNVNARNKVGATCLHFACFVDTFSPDAAVALVRHGAVAEIAEPEFGCTPLHWAAFSGDVELCATLCRAGANPTTLDKNGCDPIHYSKQNGHAECARLLESFSKSKTGAAVSPFAGATHATFPSISSENSEWVRCLDGSTGASFYNNRDTGESLWGDEYRKVDLQACEPSVVDIKNPPKVEPNDAKTDKHQEAIDLVHVRHVPASCKLGKQPPNALTAVAEDLVEVSSNEGDEPNAGISQRSPEKELGGALSCGRNIDDDEDRKRETLEVSSPPNSSVAVKDVDIDARDPLVIHSPTADSNVILAMNQSFEERISSLHLKMESHLMHRLQHLEEKMAQQNLEISTKAADESSKMKANIAEMVSTILRLQTEIGTKDLEILSLKQKLVKLESERIIKPPCVNMNVGDGNVHDDGMRTKNDELLAANACREHELDNARNEISRLKNEVDASTKALSIANGQYEQAQRHLESAAMLAREEKASHSFTMTLLEQAKKGGEADSELTLSLQEEKHHAEKTIVQLKEQLRCVESNLLEERIGLTNKLSAEQLTATKLAKEIEKTAALHSVSIAELNDHHIRELEQLKKKLKCTNSELVDTQAKLKEAKMTTLELMVSKDEAVHAMENALAKARSSESKLQEMTVFLGKTNELKEANDRLYVSLNDEAEKRKVLHNTLEDLKGRIRVYVRVRPLSEAEVKADYKSVLTKEGERTCVMEADAATASDVRDWEFDKIFLGSNANGNTQEAVFRDTSLLITSAIDGFNVSAALIVDQCSAPPMNESSQNL
jgi:hypothetical protein